MAAIKGIFYDFDSQAQFDALVQKIRKRCAKEEGGCEIWPGDMYRNHPRYRYRHKAPVYNLRRLIFQAANPNIVIPSVPYKVMCSCNNSRCLCPEHLVLSVREEWNVEDIRKRLIAGATRVLKDGFEVGCLLWNGSKVNGYGSISVCNNRYGVHILASLLRDGLKVAPKGPDGNSLLVRHRCANPHCCEESHLEWGTPKQNSEDRVRDGTSGVGENNPCAKLSSATASAVKNSWRPKGDPEYLTQVRRAEIFGVTRSVVKSIDQETTWRHIPGPANKPKPVREERETAKFTRDDLDEEVMKMLVAKIATRVQITHNISKDPTITTPCHIFTGTTTRGYGYVCHRGLDLRAHVIVCEYTSKMRTPEKHVVRHLCGNPLCCAADHLRIGTYRENSIDSVLHGSSVAKLSADDVQAIRRIPLTDTTAIQQAAVQYDVTCAHVQAIITGRRWGFLE